MRRSVDGSRQEDKPESATIQSEKVPDNVFCALVPLWLKIKVQWPQGHQNPRKSAQSASSALQLFLRAA
jgi:hypothetical protein